MKCLCFNGSLKYMDDYDKPVPEADEALIKVILTGICNTDLEIIQGYKGFQGVLGHEFVGVVEQAPDPSLIGKRVVGDINIGCNDCINCKNNYHHHCENRHVLGILGKDGAFAEYITLPVKNLYVVPDNVTDIEAVFAEPLAAALEITEKFHIKPTHNVAVLGDGKLGQLVARVLSLTGCNLYVIGKHEERLRLLKGIAKTIILTKANYKGFFDIVVECTGNSQGLSFAQDIVKPSGTIILKSTYQGKLTMNPSGWVVNEVTLMGSRCGPMDAALRILESKLVNVEPLVSYVFTLEEFEKAFQTRNSMKVLFKLN